MPIPFAVGNTIRLRVWSVAGNQAAVNTMNYDVVTAGGSPTTDQAFCNYADGIIAPLYKLALSDDATYRGVQVQVITAAPQIFVAAFSNANAGVGSNGASLLPTQVRGIISFQSALAGRRFRGRMYPAFASITANTSATGAPTAAYQTLLFNLGQAFLGLTGPIAAGGSVLQPVLIHRAGKSPIPPATPITSGSVELKWATQRRSGQFGRANSSPI